MKLRLLSVPVILTVLLATAMVPVRAEEPFSVGKLIGLPLLGDDASPVGDIDDVLISNDGRITAFVVGLSGRDREVRRVRVPWADVSVERNPLQVKLVAESKTYVAYPGPPSGTLGDINGALVSFIVGAPAKTRLGERVGETVSLNATADGRIIDVKLAQGGAMVPLPWSFVEVRGEKSTFPTERNIDPVVIVDRPE
jgi:sporulation protein YlmC with PRC-barrel domain